MIRLGRYCSHYYRLLTSSLCGLHADVTSESYDPLHVCVNERRPDVDSTLALLYKFES